ncbi:MAG TPA: TrkA C-terminal domain-containing protein [Armatimonadota bacterium]|jgi:putative transport protein
MLNTLLAEQMLILFVILAIGSLIGHLSWRGISLGSAGVLATALVFGHLGFSVSKEVRDLGLLLFVYAVGLQAGPRFFRTFKRRGIQFVVIAVAAISVALVMTVVVAKAMHLPFDLASGLFCGGLTNTPALAAASETAKSYLPAGQDPVTAVGYGIAYPYSMIGIVLLIQLMPRFMQKRIKADEARWRNEQQDAGTQLHNRQFLITNPACDGLTVQEVNPDRMTLANICRIRKSGQVQAVTPSTSIALGDVVSAVGTDEELQKLRLLLGEETHMRMDIDTNVTSQDVEITSNNVAGKTIAELDVWGSYDVVITRTRRQDVEFVPTGETTLDIGDTIRVVGERKHVEHFAKFADAGHQKADETNMVPFFLGLVFGAALGTIPVTLPNGMQVKLGVAGGSFVVSLLIGHFGGIGKWRLRVPQAARNLTRELGLMLFLAGAGTTAGSRFMEVFHQYGWALLGAGALVTTLSAIVALGLAIGVYRMSVLGSLAALAAVMTNPPGLKAASDQTETEIPAVAYASVYPVAMIFKVLTAQFLVQILWRLVGTGR